MKKLIIPALFLFTIPFVSQAQYSAKNKQWERPQANMKPGGYWVAESNIKTPRINTIHFYNNNNELIGSHELNGKKLNLDKSSTRQMLDNLLDKALDGWTPQQSASKEKKVIGNSGRS